MAERYRRPQSTGVSTRLWLGIAGAALLGLVACQASTNPAAPSNAGQGSPTNASAAASSQPSSSAAAAPVAKPQGLSPLLEAAKQDGALTVYGGGPDLRTAAEAFGKEFPDIHVDGTYAPPGTLVSRMLAERAAGKYIPDTVFGLGASVTVNLKPQGAVQPLLPIMALPEVLDLNGWQDHHFWWSDAAEPYTALTFVGRVQEVVAYNTSQVDPKAITSYWNLLDPKWKGKIVSVDVREPGSGPTWAAYVYKNPELGPTFLERLLTEMNLTLSKDPRQMVDWVAQGRFAIGLNISRPTLLEAIDQGLPINVLPGDQLKEGASMTAGGGSVSAADRPPHPAALKLFVNWLLSKEGQASWQKLIRENSLRTDISKEGIPGFNIPKPGVKYVHTSTEEYTRIVSDELAGWLNKLYGDVKS